MKPIAYITSGIMIGLIASYFFFSYTAKEISFKQFQNGIKAESSAMSRFLAEKAIETDEGELKLKVLTISCIASSEFLKDVNKHDLHFEGIEIVKSDAEIAYAIAKENGIQACLE